MYFCSTPFKEDTLHSFRVIRQVITSHQKCLPRKQLEISLLNESMCWEIGKVMKSILVSTLLIQARYYVPALRGNGTKGVPPPHTPSCLHTLAWLLGQSCSSFGSKSAKNQELYCPCSKEQSRGKGTSWHGSLSLSSNNYYKTALKQTCQVDIPSCLLASGRTVCNLCLSFVTSVPVLTL